MEEGNEAAGTGQAKGSLQKLPETEEGGTGRELGIPVPIQAEEPGRRGFHPLTEQKPNDQA